MEYEKEDEQEGDDDDEDDMYDKDDDCKLEGGFSVEHACDGCPGGVKP